MMTWNAKPQLPLLRQAALLALLFIFSLATASAQSPVRWQVSAKLEADNSYTLTLQGTLQPGWHVHAESDPQLGLEALRLEAADPFSVLDAPRPLVPLPLVQDPLLGNKWVTSYRDTLALEQRLCIQGPVPAYIALTLTGFAASEEAFLPLREELRVSLPGGQEHSAALSGSLQLASLELARASSCGKQRLPATAPSPPFFCWASWEACWPCSPLVCFR